MRASVNGWFSWPRMNAKQLSKQLHEKNWKLRVCKIEEKSGWREKKLKRKEVEENGDSGERRLRRREVMSGSVIPSGNGSGDDPATLPRVFFFSLAVQNKHRARIKSASHAWSLDLQERNLMCVSGRMPVYVPTLEFLFTCSLQLDPRQAGEPFNLQSVKGSIFLPLINLYYSRSIKETQTYCH